MTHRFPTISSSLHLTPRSDGHYARSMGHREGRSAIGPGGGYGDYPGTDAERAEHFRVSLSRTLTTLSVLALVLAMLALGLSL